LLRKDRFIRQYYKIQAHFLEAGPQLIKRRLFKHIVVEKDNGIWGKSSRLISRHNEKAEKDKRDQGGPENYFLKLSYFGDLIINKVLN
jgi:hypothetical protein